MSNGRRKNQLRVHLIPVTNVHWNEPARIEDIKGLVAKIVLSSSQRGRPRNSDGEEMSHAA